MSTNCLFSLIFFFNDTATTEIYTRSLVAASDVYKRQALYSVTLYADAGLLAYSRKQWDALERNLHDARTLSLIHISEPTRPY